MRRLKIKTGYDKITKELSATASAKEFFAEAVSEYFDSNTPSRLSTEVFKIIVEELKSIGG